MGGPYGRDTGTGFTSFPQRSWKVIATPSYWQGNGGSWKAGNLPTVTWLVTRRPEIRTHLTRPLRVYHVPVAQIPSV